MKIFGEDTNKINFTGAKCHYNCITGNITASVATFDQEVVADGNIQKSRNYQKRISCSIFKHLKDKS